MRVVAHLRFCLILVLASDVLTAGISKHIKWQAQVTGVHWLRTEEFKAIDLQNNTKPIMYFFNWRTCPVCRDLVKDFSQHKKTMASLTQHFVCVNVLDDDNWDYGSEYEPNKNDYIPRIMFAEPNGKLRYDIVNPETDAHQAYYYWTAEGVVRRMEAYLEERLRLKRFDFS